MKQHKVVIAVGAVCLAVSAVCLFAQQASQGVPVSMTVTLEPKRGKTVPPIEPQDVKVTEANQRRPVTALLPLTGDHAAMQLMLLIDDSARTSLDTQLPTLKDFVNSLPATTEIAIGYMSYGMSRMVSNFTRDHAAAANSLRVTMGPGGADVSPYDSLSDAIKHWPQSSVERKEVIMISSGIEGLGGGYTSQNPYVMKGIEDAQKAGVIVYTIYNPSVGHYGHSWWRMNWGQNFLSQLSDETGGESYFIGFGPPVTFAPFLDDIKKQFSNQYKLTFSARPEQKAGLQPVKVSIIEKDASIAAADKVWVPASM